MDGLGSRDDMLLRPLCRDAGGQLLKARRLSQTKPNVTASTTMAMIASSEGRTAAVPLSA